MRNLRTVFVFGAGLLFAGGCTVGPRYAPPKLAMAPHFSEARNDIVSPPSSRIVPGEKAIANWWLVFGDVELNSLIERAAHGNLDLQEAVSRVRQARAERAAITAGLWPAINASASYERGHGSKNVVLPFGGGGAGGASGGSSSNQNRDLTSRAELSAGGDSGGVAGNGGAAASGPPASPFGQGGLPGVTTNIYQIGFDASWEIDLFGGTRRAIEAAEAGIAATEEAQRAALVSLLAEVATTYVELRVEQQRLHIARENLAAQNDTLQIVEAKFKTGFATDLDVAQQTAQVSSLAATIPALEAAERDGAHTLAFLIGARPDALTTELISQPPLPPLPPTVPVGVPSDLLRRRPDIRRAERELALSTAQLGVATADFLPKFSLTGAFGLDSSDLRNLPDWDSHYYSIAPGIRWPILDWGRIRANVRVETERQQQAFLEYQKTVLQALKDVEDALVHYEKEQTRRASLAESVNASRHARELAQERYAHGVTDVLTTIETQRALLLAEDALAQSDGALRRDLIALYKALGGGWE